MELLDTATRSTDGGERDYGDGAAAVASAMAGEREGEELGRRGDVRGVRGREGERSTSRLGEGSGEAATRCVAPMRCSPPSTLPACLAEPSSSLARQLGWAGRWAG